MLPSIPVVLADIPPKPVTLLPAASVAPEKTFVLLEPTFVCFVFFLFSSYAFCTELASSLYFASFGLTLLILSLLFDTKFLSASPALFPLKIAPSPPIPAPINAPGTAPIPPNPAPIAAPAAAPPPTMPSLVPPL